MRTQVKLHGAARKVILKAVNLIYDTVKITLGPEFGTVLLHRSFNRGSRITNDGVTIAKCIEPKDPFENLVSIAFKESASKTGERVGDGTTSTICIAGKLINDSFSQIKDDDKSQYHFRGMDNCGESPIKLKKRILSEIPKIKEEISKVTKKIEKPEELENIADVSLGGNREVAKIVSDLVWKTGINGFISLGDSFTGKLEVEPIEGARFPMKPIFLNRPEHYEMFAQECDVMVTDFKIDSLKDFYDFWQALETNKLIIFAPDFSDAVISQMAKMISPQRLPNGQIVPSGIQIFPVKCSSLGSEDGTPHNFKDLAIFCGATFINKKEHKLREVKKYDLGFLEQCTVKSVEDREDAKLIGGKGGKEEIEKRIEVLKQQKDKVKLPEHKAFIDKRIASLASAGGMIKVGAPTEAEALPLKHKIEDAIFACQAALRFGYVEGGGLCLKKIAEDLYKDDQLLKDALCAPYNQIQENSGGIEIGENIIDPAKVVELEVEHAFGVAANLITCKAIIPEVDEHDERDGYKEIGDAITLYTKLWAKREGLYQDGLNEGEKERLQKEERMIANEGSD